MSESASGRGPRQPWLAPVAALGLLLLGTIAVTVAVTLRLSDASLPARMPSSSAQAPATPARPTGALPPSGSVGDLVDPAWLARTATAAEIAEPALAAYAGAAIAAEAAHPGCGLGWNTLAAIGLLDSEHGGERDASGPMRIEREVWAALATDGSGDGVPDPQDLEDAALTVALHLCAAGGDLTQADGWSTGVAAHNAGLDYTARVRAAADRYAAAAGS